MSRPKKRRMVCRLPEHLHFGPLGVGARGSGDVIKMTVDAYETIRLIDLYGFTQEQCAVQMGVSRTTVQAIYDNARKIIAESLINGKVIQIEGGEYSLCGEQGGCGGPGCVSPGCHRHRGGRFADRNDDSE